MFREWLPAFPYRFLCGVEPCYVPKSSLPLTDARELTIILTKEDFQGPLLAPNPACLAICSVPNLGIAQARHLVFDGKAQAGRGRPGKSELEEPNISAVDHKMIGQSGELTWKGVR